MENERRCKDCVHYRVESGLSGKYTYGKCAKLHTNANHALIWMHPSDYVPGDEVQVYADFGCILWEPLTDRAKVLPE
jgi:hypothetical protein